MATIFSTIANAWQANWEKKILQSLATKILQYERIEMMSSEQLHFHTYLHQPADAHITYTTVFAIH